MPHGFYRIFAGGLDGGGNAEEDADGEADGDAEDHRFLAPGDMPSRIARACRDTEQPVPGTRGAMVRCILESLALAHRRALREAAELAGRDVEVVHLVGGGARKIGRAHV